MIKQITTENAAQVVEQLRDELYQHVDDALIPTATHRMLKRAVITLTELRLFLETQNEVAKRTK